MGAVEEEPGVQVVRELGAVEVPSLLHPRRRIVVLRRRDGLYTFAEQYEADSEDGAGTVAPAWCTLPAEGIHASADLAEAEGRRALAQRYRLPG